MSAECKHGRYFPDGDECCGLCAGEEINALKARIAKLDLVVAKERDQLRARPERHAGLHPEVPSSDGAFFTFAEVTQIRGAIHHTFACPPRPEPCTCGCDEAFDVLNRKVL